MAGGVAIDILRVDVSTVLDQSLNHAEVASQARDVKRSTEVVCPGVNLGSELDQNLNQWCVALTRSQMERGETVRVGAIHDFEHLVVLIEVLLGEGQYLHDLCPVALVDLGPVVHLYFLDVLLPVFLLLRFLALARVALDRLAHLVDLRVLRAATGSRLSRLTGTLRGRIVGLVVAFAHVLHLLLLAVVGELVGLLVVVVIAHVDVDVVLRILAVLVLSVLGAVVEGALRSRGSAAHVVECKALGLDRVRHIL